MKEYGEQPLDWYSGKQLKGLKQHRKIEKA